MTSRFDPWRVSRHPRWLALAALGWVLAAAVPPAQGGLPAPAEDHRDATFEWMNEDTAQGIHWRSQLSCGVSASYFLLKSHGLDVKYAQVGSLVPIDPERGSRLSDMTRCCQRLGLHVSAVAAGPGEIRSFPLPAILHLTAPPGTPAGSVPGHYVVLLKIDGDEATLFDSSEPQPYRVAALGALLRGWSGTALVVRPYRQFLSTYFWELTCLTATVLVGSVWVYSRFIPGR